jgi:isochorismate synthase
VVPEVVYGAESTGAEWVTVLAAEPSDLPVGSDGLRAWLVGISTGAPGPSRAVRNASGRSPTIVPHTSDASFEAMVAESVRAVESDEVAKVVVSRQVDVRMGEPIDVAALLGRWHRLEPTASLFSMPTTRGQLVGASPELLVERIGTRVRSRPLAGTTDRTHESGSVLPRELLASTKDSAEHRLVVESIGDVLGPLCSDLEVPDLPDLVHLHNITHLGTTVVGALTPREDGSVPTALELVAALHPTPAVGGVPRDRALALISRLEPEARGHFAGPVGYVDARGDGRWMIGIRAMTVTGSDALLAAGVGVVHGSDPGTELVEVNLKLTAAFDALAPGAAFTTRDGPPAREAVG